MKKVGSVQVDCQQDGRMVAGLCYLIQLLKIPLYFQIAIFMALGGYLNVSFFQYHAALLGIKS